MNVKEITISAKASKDYQSVSRTYTIELDEEDDLEKVEAEIAELREELHEVVVEDVEQLCRETSEQKRQSKTTKW